MASSSSRRRSRSPESCRACLCSHVYDSPTPHPWETACCLAPEEGGGEAETGRRKWLCALSQGSQGRAEGQELRTEGGERQLRAAAQDQLLPLLAGRPEQVVGQLEAWSRVRLRGGVALSPTFLLSGVVNGCFIALSLCLPLSDRKCPSLCHWPTEPTACSHSADSGLKGETLTWTPALPNPAALSTRGMPMPRPHRAPYSCPEFGHWLALGVPGRVDPFPP